MRALRVILSTFLLTAALATAVPASTDQPQQATIKSGVGYATIPGAGTMTASHAAVKVAYNKKLRRRILVNAEGLALYLWSLEIAGKPTCYDDSKYHCSRAWPPLRSANSPVARQSWWR